MESFRTNDSQIGVKSFLENGPGKAEFTGHLTGQPTSAAIASA